MQPSQLTPENLKTSLTHWHEATAGGRGIGISFGPKQVHETQSPAAAPSGQTSHDFFGPHQLPDPTGPQAPTRQVKGALSSITSGATDESSMYMAYALMQRIDQQDLATFGSLLRSAQNTATYASRHEAKHSLDQVLGQNKSTVLNACGMATLAGVTILSVVLGTAHDTPLLGQVASQASTIGQPIIGWVDRASTTLGGSIHANVASLAMKDDAIHQRLSTTMVETLKAAKEAIQDSVRRGADLLEGHLRRKAETLDRMAQ